MSITVHLIYGAVIPLELESQFMIDAGFIDPYDAKHNFDPVLYYKRCPDCLNRLDDFDTDDEDVETKRPNSMICIKCIMLNENTQHNINSKISNHNGEFLDGSEYMYREIYNQFFDETTCAIILKRYMVQIVSEKQVSNINKTVNSPCDEDIALFKVWLRRYYPYLKYSVTMLATTE